jgi:hypothetical protein
MFNTTKFKKTKNKSLEKTKKKLKIIKHMKIRTKFQLSNRFIPVWLKASTNKKIKTLNNITNKTLLKYNITVFIIKKSLKIKDVDIKKINTKFIMSVCE